MRHLIFNRHTPPTNVYSFDLSLDKSEEATVGMFSPKEGRKNMENVNAIDTAVTIPEVEPLTAEELEVLAIKGEFIQDAIDTNPEVIETIEADGANDR